MKEAVKKKKIKIKKKPSGSYRQKVLIEVLHDRSGSMGVTWEENLSGFKFFVHALEQDKTVDQHLALTVFDTEVLRVYDGPVDTGAAVLALEKAPPRGMTALYDAIGDSLERVKSCESDFDKVIVVVITDGQENASRLFDKEKTHTAIDSALAKGKYTFTYLGTQPETWKDASKIGMSAGNTVSYDTKHIGGTYSIAAASLNNFKSSGLRSTRSLYADHGSKLDMIACNFTVASDADARKKDDILDAAMAKLTTTS